MPPGEIEVALDIEATKAYLRDPSSKYRPRREWNSWQLCSENHVYSNDNSEHIHWILDNLHGKEKALEELRSKECSIVLTNFWDSTGQGGPSLNIKTMESLVRFGLPISWDIYFDEENET